MFLLGYFCHEESVNSEKEVGVLENATNFTVSCFITQ